MPWQGRTAQTKRPCLTTPPGNHLFYPRPPRGGRPNFVCKQRITAIFLSAPSVRRATLRCPRLPTSTMYFYPRPLRGGRRFPVPQPDSRTRISIHALREEGDGCHYTCPECIVRNFYPRPPRGGRHFEDVGNVPGLFISIHALREEGDSSQQRQPRTIPAFLSTPSARRATVVNSAILAQFLHFYPRPPRGGRLPHWSQKRTPGAISIHALREEGDKNFQYDLLNICDFYPRPPRGGRPPAAVLRGGLSEFLSTPSSRRATCPCQLYKFCHRYFYPRPPRGGRLFRWLPVHIVFVFLSTPSARRATSPPRCSLSCCCISIHASVRRATHFSQRTYRKPVFLSTPSVRRATHCQPHDIAMLRISIHALREEGDGDGYRKAGSPAHFYPRPPRGGRPCITSLSCVSL